MKVNLLKNYWCVERKISTKGDQTKWCALMNGDQPEQAPELELTLCDHRHEVNLTMRYRVPSCSKCMRILHDMINDGVR